MEFIYRHDEIWEDMIQEIALINLVCHFDAWNQLMIFFDQIIISFFVLIFVKNLEPGVKKISRIVLKQLTEDDDELNSILEELNDDQVVIESDYDKFESLKQLVLTHSDKRKTFIDDMDKKFHEIEKDRVENIRSIINKYSEVLFRINYFPRPQIERLLDAEIQVHICS